MPFLHRLWDTCLHDKGSNLGRGVRLAECCAYYPRCVVGERRGHLVGVHDDTVFTVHFDDGEYAVFGKDEVEILYREEALA